MCAVAPFPTGTVFVLLLLLSMAGPAAAGPFQDGVAAYGRGDFGTAYSIFKPLAEKGDANSQHNLGVMYENGQGVPRDYAEAMKWYGKAAAQGKESSCNNIGAMYEEGLGVPQDYAEAVKWFRKAAEWGKASAQYNLGIKYKNGRGVERDYVQAYKWFSIAASKDSASAAEARERSRNAMEDIASLMTPDQIAEARRLAREWKPKK